MGATRQPAQQWRPTAREIAAQAAWSRDRPPPWAPASRRFWPRLVLGVVSLLTGLASIPALFVPGYLRVFIVLTAVSIGTAVVEWALR